MARLDSTAWRRTALATALAASGMAHAATLQVPSQYATLQEAVAHARPGDEIRVSAGTYHGTVTVRVGIDIVSVSGPRHTTIEGSSDDFDPVVAFYVPDGQRGRFKGFTVTGGVSYESGGGMAVGGPLMVEGNVLSGNYGFMGGGLFIWGAGPTIRHNRFTGNQAEYGGGVYDGSGDHTLIADNDFEGNRAVGPGGGIDIAYGSPVVLRNIITGNEANDGAGIASSAASPYVADNLIHANAGPDSYSGGGVLISGVRTSFKSEGVWVNNTIADNRAEYGSQVAVTFENHRALIANNAISASDGSVAVYCDPRDGSLPRFENNDVYSNGAAAAGGSCAAAAVGGTNLSVPAGFVTSARGHAYHLGPDSPLVDAGTNRVVRRVHRDLDGGPRIVDGGHGAVVDIGAYEFRP